MVLVFILMFFYEGAKLLRAFLQRGQITEGLFTEGPFYSMIVQATEILTTLLFVYMSSFAMFSDFKSFFVVLKSKKYTRFHGSANVFYSKLLPIFFFYSRLIPWLSHVCGHASINFLWPFKGQHK